MTVTTADIGAARVITWDRQARRNAWDLPTMTAIAAEIEVASRDADVRMVAVQGAGGHFSAGDDLQAAIEADTAAWAETIEAFQRMTRVVLAAPVPVAAVVDGVCVGGALEFAASCDLRLCSNRVRLLTPEVGIGLVASNAGTLLLPEVLGESAARELLLSGEERDADWAREHGFATELVAPAGAREAHRALGGDLLADITRRGGGHEGDAERALRRAAERRDGPRDLPLRAPVRRAGRPRRAERVRRARLGGDGTLPDVPEPDEPELPSREDRQRERKARRSERPQGMVPTRERRRTKLERGTMRLVATGGIIGIAVALGAVLVSQDVAGWIVGLVIGVTTVVLCRDAVVVAAAVRSV